MLSKKVILILLTILVLVCQNREKQLLQRWFGLILSQGAATVIPPWVIADAGQLTGHTWYHLMFIISALLVTQKIYVAEVKKKKVQLLILGYNQD